MIRQAKDKEEEETIIEEELTQEELTKKDNIMQREVKEGQEEA